MKIYKKLNGDFTVASNEIFRHNLSFKAIGLYLYIVSKPDGWDFSVAGAMKQAQDGKDSIRSGLKELEAAGFLRRTQARGGGKFAGNEWIVADKPLAENPPAGNPSAENPTQVNTKEEKTKLVKHSPSENGADAPTVTQTPQGGIVPKPENHGVVIDGSTGKGRAVDPQTFGNAYVSELIEYLKVRMELPMLDDSKPKNRQYCWNLMRKFGKGPDGKFSPELGRDKVRMIIDQAALSEMYQYKITSMWKLWLKAVEIMSSPRNQKGGVTSLER